MKTKNSFYMVEGNTSGDGFDPRSNISLKEEILYELGVRGRPRGRWGYSQDLL